MRLLGIFCLFVVFVFASIGSGQRTDRPKPHPTPKPKPSPTTTPTATPTPNPTATPSPTATATPTPLPLSGDAWTTYGHDAERTGASEGNIPGALTEVWRYRPTSQAVELYPACSVGHAIATSDAVYVRWMLCSKGTTELSRVNLEGQQQWSMSSCCNWDRQHWPTLTPDGTRIFGNDDGGYLRNAQTGTPERSGFVGDVKTFDVWGDTLIDPSGQYFFTVNMHHQLDPGGSWSPVYVANYRIDFTARWRNIQFNTNQYGPEDILGGALAYQSAADTLFQAVNWNAYPGKSSYTTPPNGIHAWLGATGAQRWFVAATPTSRISIDDNSIYLIEGTAEQISPTGSARLLSGKQLVARRQSDGSVIWSRSVSFPVILDSWVTNPDGTFTHRVVYGTHVQAPVLANGLVIIGTAYGVEAFEAATGSPVWSTPLTGAAALQNYQGGNSQAADTSLAAALGSGTLVVTADDGVHVLSLINGMDFGAFMPASAIGKVRNPIIVGPWLYVIDGTTSANGGLIALEAQ